MTPPVRHRDLRAAAAALRQRLEGELLSGLEHVPVAGPEAGPAGGAEAPRTLTDLEADLQGCRRCPLGAGRKNLVFGCGNPDAELMFIGEGPGAEEDRQGIPFVGPAGELLTRMIRAMGLRREDVYIANIVKCRPPKNRDPEASEIDACIENLLAQARTVRPRVLCLLGRVATQVFLKTDQSLGRMRGRWHEWEGIPVMPTYHPAYLLREPSAKKTAWQDLQKVMSVLKDKES